jgi:hypothetical protein
MLLASRPNKPWVTVYNLGVSTKEAIMAQFIYKLAEVVMFVITGSPRAINRMKARKGGFFKGRVLKETSKDVWIEPLNEALTERLMNLSFFRDVAIIKSGRVVVLNEQDMKDLQGTKDKMCAKHKTNDIRFANCVIIPKKQVEHWLGEKRRFNDSLEALAKSDLVKERSKKTKMKKDIHWVYKA